MNANQAPDTAERFGQGVAPTCANVENGILMSRMFMYQGRESEAPMAEITIVYWRDIPAQVIAGKGRRGVKRPLPERFEQAIDRAAMKTGLTGTDAYLSEWRKGDAYVVEGDDEAAATSEAARIDRDYDTGRLKALIDNEGRA